MEVLNVNAIGEEEVGAGGGAVIGFRLKTENILDLTGKHSFQSPVF
jgi:hypothetical protein